eukprot:GHVL01024405.1.p1 GENE.GHVL01024405.1~~GHVL01024405.1.p1  ORF type:complete len:112 (+),score=0.43 GHVL01024405.1:162-497(+)
MRLLSIYTEFRIFEGPRGHSRDSCKSVEKILGYNIDVIRYGSNGKKALTLHVTTVKHVTKVKDQLTNQSVGSFGSMVRDNLSLSLRLSLSLSHILFLFLFSFIIVYFSALF